MEALTIIIILPIVAGILLFLIPEKTALVKGIFTLVISIAVMFYVIYLLYLEPGIKQVSDTSLPAYFSGVGAYLTFNVDQLAKLIVFFIGFFSLLILLFSLKYINKYRKIDHFYSYYLITIGCAFGAAVSDNLILFITFWGILGFTLYKLIQGHDSESSSAAKKTLIIIGASDSLMILGIGLIWLRTATFNMSGIHLATDTATSVIAFLCLLIGSFTKAGAFPFHSWIPDFAKSAPAPSSAFLPASLDKLLGIYLMARLCIYMFELNQWLTLCIIITGVATIIIAVMMALIQHNYKKLLGYHAVSQVGYMVLGIGLGTPLGIAGGIFHMINHALYKSGLFLTAGSLEKKTGQDEIGAMGGLAKAMPITFVSALIFAFAISGIPPFNGFASKWVIYQAIIDFGSGTGLANRLWIIWLALAVFGSALTLASFIKLISGTFLGRLKTELQHVKEVGIFMWIPMIILAIVCTAFGVFAVSFVLPTLLEPVTGELAYVGIWKSAQVSVLILISVLVGTIIYLSNNLSKFRTDESFIGGEKLQQTASFSPLEFYKTISQFRILSYFYEGAEKKWFDIYDQSKRLILYLNKTLSFAHTGILSHYAAWIIIGLILMMILMIL